MTNLILGHTSTFFKTVSVELKVCILNKNTILIMHIQYLPIFLYFRFIRKIILYPFLSRLSSKNNNIFNTACHKKGTTLRVENYEFVARCVKTYMHASLVIPIVRTPKNITIHLSSYSPIGKNDTLSLGGKKNEFFSDQTICFYIYHQHTYITIRF